MNRPTWLVFAVCLSVWLWSSAALAQKPAAAPAGPDPSASEPASAPDAVKAVTLEQQVDAVFAKFNGIVGAALFYPVPLMVGEKPPTAPLAVLWLVFGAVFLTLRMGFINFRGFRHAVDITLGSTTAKRTQGGQSLSGAVDRAVGHRRHGNIAGWRRRSGWGGREPASG